ncbi:MAG: bifunctional rhamnulose-1-phosphate aldolase/short-chain dehydrogenase [Alphaproteobacteria bacterium]|nr:bifunctional rhamnulose-1-phosphate aldolase/short-chain dehydrogenase [Alphaproteobacteria bacterium]
MPAGLESHWTDAKAAALSEPELLLYRSNLLGSDLRITNFGGGNTSAKIASIDPLTNEATEVLWVKGSGGDLGSMKLDGFATLYLENLRRLRPLYKGLDHEDEMVGYLPHCTFNLNARAASIDTPLHAFIPHAHVDHMHPDSIIAIACAKGSEVLTKEVFEGRLGWLAWQRPGFDLGLKLGDLAEANPSLNGVILQGHGLFTWADASKACYLKTLEMIQLATDWLDAKDMGAAFGERRVADPFDADERRKIASALMPIIRGKISQSSPKIGHLNDCQTVLDFVDAARVDELAAIGTSCPDHFLRTKIRPLVLDIDPKAGSIEQAVTSATLSLDQKLENYRIEYGSYYERCRRETSPAMRDANAVVYLAPGIGMFTFARDKATARIAGEFYVNAINVMRGAENAGGYVGLAEQEAFDIEYWLLEEAKLQRMPKPKRLAGKVALITGGAGGIGAATARRLLKDGACVMLADIDGSSVMSMANELAEEFSSDVVAAVQCDVTNEAAVAAALREIAVTFGGIDILVSNAGIASAAPLDETSLDLWNRNINVLATGYFLMTRETFKVMKQQDRGGSIIFVGSKNALVASSNAVAYCTAKAAELQLARVVALEGAPFGVRCNVVNPDAVLRGSKIWSGDWKKERAQAYSITEAELEEHYRQRSLLKRNVYPEDIAEAIAFFASDVSAKSTGNIINVDAGHAPAFTR